MRTDKGFTLAEEMLSWLHNNNVIFPSVDVIERTLAEAVTFADRSVFSALTTQLGKQHRSALDSLLISEGEQPSRLAWLLEVSLDIENYCTASLFFEQACLSR